MWQYVFYVVLIAVAIAALYGAYHLNAKYQKRNRKRKRAIRKKDEKWLEKQQAFLDQQRRRS